uniref:Adrenoceptor alpha 1B n=1 Tax=Cynoglossus semilaevis TaxID=244447 RepID=A0A3P8V922_CYNSE
MRLWRAVSGLGSSLTHYPRRALAVGIVLASFILFAIVGNMLVILAVVCNPHLRTPTNYFIINLAMADLLLGTTVLPVSATQEVLDYWVFGQVFCDIWAAVDVLCCTASIMSLCVISIDRYVGVRYPLQYPTIVTQKRALLAMLCVWILSITISIGPLLGWKQPPSQDNTTCQITEEPFYTLFSSLGSFYIPLAVILVMYCRVYIVAKRTTRNLKAGVMKQPLEDANELTLRIHCRNQQVCPGRSTLAVKLFKFSREKKAAKTLGVVVGMFILCWLPFFLVLPMGSFNSDLRPPETCFKVIFWLGYFNSCLNPIIYPCYSREFKQVGLAGLLQSHDGGALEAQVGLEVLGDLPDQALEGQLADQQLRGLLVATDLTQSHGAGPVPVGLLHAAGGGGALTGCLGGQLLPGSLTSGGLTGGLLRSGHGFSVFLSLFDRKIMFRRRPPCGFYSVSADAVDDAVRMLLPVIGQHTMTSMLQP